MKLLRVFTAFGIASITIPFQVMRVHRVKEKKNLRLLIHNLHLQIDFILLIASNVELSRKKVTDSHTFIKQLDPVEQEIIAMEKPVRKRGRPPITKNYKNPLESPMAHSSLKVQKLGAQSFSKPMMKIGQFTPSPRNRRTSSCSSTSSNSAGSACGNTNGEELIPSGPFPGSKKGRFRGVILSTPTKKSLTTSTSSTPSSSDSIFQSSSRMSLKSSPPIATSPLQAEMEGKATLNGDASQLFKFALTIGENGRATIAGSSPLSTPSKNTSVISESERDDSSNLPKAQKQTNYEKKRVLNLLRQMRSGAGSSRIAKKVHNFSNPKAADGRMVHDSSKEKNVQREQNSPYLKVSRAADNMNSQLSPAVFVPRSPSFPSTPKTSFPVKTGLTPGFGIDQVLLDIVSSPRAGILAGNDSHIITLSPRNRPLTKQHGSNVNTHIQQQQQQQQQQFVFKFSSADPLLLTDEADGNWSEAIYSHLQSSPKTQICFNTPPSWVNLGSPRAFSPQRRDSSTILISACHSSGNELQSEYRAQVPSSNAAVNSRSSILLQPQTGISTAGRGENIVREPSTPGGQQPPLPTMIQCTPLIQQTMAGSLNPKFMSRLISVGALSEDGKEVNKTVTAQNEQEDAIVALKKLITSDK